MDARAKAVKSLLGSHGSAPSLTPSLTRAYYHTHLASDPVAARGVESLDRLVTKIPMILLVKVLRLAKYFVQG